MFAPRYFAPRYFAPRYWPPSGQGTSPGEPGVILGGFEYTGSARDLMHMATVVELTTTSTVVSPVSHVTVLVNDWCAGHSERMYGANVVDEAHSSTVALRDYVGSPDAPMYGSTVRDRSPEAE